VNYIIPFPKTTRHLEDAAHEVDGVINHPLFWALAVIAIICVAAWKA
jgi:hypothetical protein